MRTAAGCPRAAWAGWTCNAHALPNQPSFDGKERPGRRLPGLFRYATAMPADTSTQAWRLNPKHALFAFVALMLGYVIYHNERFLIDQSNPAWPHYRIIGRWLLPHGLAGATALLLGMSQFSTRLRTRHTQLHRVLGRTYVIAVSIVAPLGAYIQYLNEEQLGDSRSFTFAAVTFASLWLLAT